MMELKQIFVQRQCKPWACGEGQHTTNCQMPSLFLKKYKDFIEDKRFYTLKNIKGGVKFSI